MKTKLILAHKDENPGRLLHYLKREDSASWIYMGRDYSHAMQWKTRMPHNVTHVEIGKELQRRAKELRRPFIDFVTMAGSSNNEFVRWSSIVFERNTVVSPVFLYCCYLEVLKDYMNRNPEPRTVIVISENWSLLETIKNNFSSPSLEVVYLQNNISKLINILKDYSKIIMHSALFTAMSLLGYATARIYGKNSSTGTNKNNPENEKNKLIVLRTWVLNNFFDKEGVFNNAYLPVLDSWIKTKGYNVAIMPLILIPKLNIKSLLKSYKNIMLSMRKSEDKFLVPWDYLKLCDVFNAFKMCLGQLWLKFNTQNFLCWDLCVLLKEDRRKFALNSRGLECALHYLLFKRLAERDIRINQVIYTFENMLTEKLFLIGAKTFYPTTKTIGFQHSVLFPLKLDTYISEKETANSPLPDKIICSGEFFRNIMSKECYPASKLEVGPALRFAHIFEKKEWDKKSQGKCVLIACPGYKNELIELLFKVLTALKDEDVSFLVKPKPDAPMTDIIDEIIKLTGISPVKIKLVSGSLSELIRQSNVMVTIASGAVFDGIASGIPTLRIKRELDLDLDPLDWLDFDPKRDFIAYTVDDVRREVRRSLNLSEQEKEWLINYGRKFIRKNFSPVTEETLSVFLN